MDTFDPNHDTITAYGMWMDKTIFHLCLALLDRVEPLGISSAIECLKAASAVRKVAGGVPTKPTEECRKWNENHRPGTAIVVEYPESPSAFIAVTTSIAFDTPSGPHVMIADSYDAVPLSAVKLYSGSAVAVMS